MGRPHETRNPAPRAGGNRADFEAGSVHNNSGNLGDFQENVEQSPAAGVNNVRQTAPVTEADDLAVRIRALMGDRSTDAEREQRMRRYYAVKSCSHCVACWKPFEAGQAVFRERRYGRDLAPVCEGCKSKYQRYDSGAQCEGCRRMVHNVISNRRRLRTFCCDRCGIHAHSREKHAKKVEERGTRECLQCAETFEPVRADAKFCSIGCKQKSYRHRVTGRVSAKECANSIRNGVFDGQP